MQDLDVGRIKFLHLDLLRIHPRSVQEERARLRADAGNADLRPAPVALDVVEVIKRHLHDPPRVRYSRCCWLSNAYMSRMWHKRSVDFSGCLRPGGNWNCTCKVVSAPIRGPMMCKRWMMFGLRLWCLLIAFLVETYAQTGDLDPVTAVTLWQFGQGEGGPNWKHEQPETSIPLIPLGTASGGVATTYLLQAVDPLAVTTTNDDGLLTTKAILSTSPFGTIVASASGWFLPFTGNQNKKPFTGTIACSSVNSTFGDCVNIIDEQTMILASGPPTPVVFQVSSTVPPTPTPTSSGALAAPPTPTNSVALTVPPMPTSSASGSASAPTSKRSSVRAGPIVGSVVGGLVLGTIIALCFLYRRRRRLFSIEDGIMPHAFTNGASAPGPDDASTHNQEVDTRENFAPQPLSVVPLRGKGTPDANVLSSAATHRPRSRHEPSRAPAASEENTPAEGISGLTIPELARMLRVYERVHGHSDQAHEDSPPPSYLSANIS
ncbi:hypothetical protein GGX14DRAFT_560877 [Mycena pura]|uniref:Mid2 domain-containing protein n=1 Tax=Mycena pura TaxID=153505 RepID=A0AAD6VW00_9AGAR|nr:hypothetical protein GGX14DRAFT_560877 [Mycena pura]